MLTLKVVNLWSGAGAGKSTTAAGLFNLMKQLGLRVELVTEYAKDLTYERNFGSLQNQLLILAQQDQRLRRLEGQVEWAITDSPLPLCEAYMSAEYEEWLPDAIEGAYDRYDNYDFLVKRVKPFQTYGRTQTEHQALTLDITVRNLFVEYAEHRPEPHVDKAWEVTGNAAAPFAILEKLKIPLPEEYR